MATTGKSKTCVRRWQERFIAGLDDLLLDKTRPSGTPPPETTLVNKVVALTLKPPAQEVPRWTVRAMAKAVGIAAFSVVKIWHDHGLAPGAASLAQLQAVERQEFDSLELHDLVDLYVSPPRTTSCCPLTRRARSRRSTVPSRVCRSSAAPVTMTHNYKRNSTTTLFAVLNVLDGLVIDLNMRRHRRQDSSAS